MERFQQPIDLGRRVVIHGATGSGKTTLSGHLGELLGVPVIQLDAIRHHRGWDSVAWDEMRALLTERLDASTDGWVCDGNYSQVRDIYISRADSLVWLHLPWRVSFWRLLWRTINRAWSKEPLYHQDGPRESWRLTFTSRKSILWWSISNHRNHVRNTRQRLADFADPSRVFVLHSRREVDAFLYAVAASLAGSHQIT
jgi:adenylate kinase family enzyme